MPGNYYGPTAIVRPQHLNPFLVDKETRCFNLIHFSHSFPFFRDFLFPRIDCSSIATRSAHDHFHAPPRPAHPPHTMDGS